MKKTKQIIALLLCLVMVVAGTVFATVAYLTAQESVLNSFTVGDVQIKVDEANTATEDVNDRTEEGNNYHLLPGETYVKDPTLTVVENSEDSYVRMIVKVENLNKLKDAIPYADHPEFYATVGEKKVFLLQNLVTGWDVNEWNYIDCTEKNNDGYYEFRYKAIVEKSDAEQKLDPLFDEIVVPTFIDNAHMKHLSEVKIKITGEAIQASTFADADAAWRAFDAQNGD